VITLRRLKFAKNAATMRDIRNAKKVVLATWKVEIT